MVVPHIGMVTVAMHMMGIAMSVAATSIVTTGATITEADFLCLHGAGATAILISER